VWLRRFGIQEGEAITHPWMSRALEKAQQKVEARNFEVRKQILKFDDVMNDQRKVIYEQRREIMDAEEIGQTIVDMRHEAIESLVDRCIPANSYAEQWEVDTLRQETMTLLGQDLPIAEWAQEEGIAEEAITERLVAAADARMAEKEATFGAETMRMVERSLLLQILDQTWKDHLLALDHLRQGISLRAYGQRDPLNEYKREAFELFREMENELRGTVTRVLAHVELRVAQNAVDELTGEIEEEGEAPQALLGPAGTEPDYRNLPISRNAPCPCGSGKKYKHCHGQI
jgi:preprotein translocase subunit SecA